jgi:hypothetical protein
MTTLNELRGGVYKMKGLIGIEIETETANPYTLPTFNHWTVHEDRSLRNFGMEYVFNYPLDPGGKAYNEAMQEWDNFSITQNFIPSVYTGLHVHLNMSNVDLKKLMNFIALYLIYENVLGRYCGPDRDGNLFCLKTSIAELSYVNFCDLAKAIDEGDGARFIQRLSEDRFKYSGLNIVTLNRLGSVEVRTHGGTVRREEIERWVNILKCIYDEAMRHDSPLSVVAMFRDNYVSNITQRIFGGLEKHFDLKNLTADVEKTIYYAVCLAKSVNDWSKFGEAKKKVFNFKASTLSQDQLRDLHDMDVEHYADMGLNPSRLMQPDQYSSTTWVPTEDI